MRAAALPRVGVLALQGASAPHVEAFARLGLAAREVRAREALDGLTHLVLPGGESTTIHRLLVLFDLVEAIRERHRAGELALFGVCAGAILLGRDEGERPPRLGLLDASVARNAYGPQLFSETRSLHLDVLGRELPCTFIRAPRLERLGPGVRVLARDGDDPIAVSQPGLLAVTFHPELGTDPALHRWFVSELPAPRATLDDRPARRDPDLRRPCPDSSPPPPSSKPPGTSPSASRSSSGASTPATRA